MEVISCKHSQSALTCFHAQITGRVEGQVMIHRTMYVEL